MIRQSLFLILGLMIALTLGCEKKESTPSVPSTSETITAPDLDHEEISKEVEEAVEDIKKAAEKN